MGKLEAFALISFLCLSTAATAGWQEHASAFDAQRLSRLDESRAKGLDEATRGASAADLAAIHSLLDAQPVSGSLAGNWRCRTIKLGGLTPDVIYTWFRCRISERDGALFFEKLSGTQRMSGFLYPQDGDFVYLGASSVKGEKPHAYSGNGAEAGAAATPDDQIGVLSLLADGRARLELPYPLQESTFDVIELKR
ncbi:MAG: DUF4893 domain-containing protein [Alphaproteobacteria bacterium]|nr:DUF4893 domain-containing protein [Alphaproteobacteria bacterium]MDE2629646.1 DUF4893 domain-containing protein [Alphaproteobacteria bacterium]